MTQVTHITLKDGYDFQLPDGKLDVDILVSSYVLDIFSRASQTMPPVDAMALALFAGIHASEVSEEIISEV